MEQKNFYTFSYILRDATVKQKLNCKQFSFYKALKIHDIRKKESS